MVESLILQASLEKHLCTSVSLWLTTSVFSRLLCVTSLQIALDRIEHRSRQLLRYPLPNRAALDQHGARYGLDGDVPAVARDPFRMILEAGRLPRGGCVPRRDVRRNRRAVDQHADRDDQILVDGTLAVMKADVVFAEQDEIVRRRKAYPNGLSQLEDAWAAWVPNSS